MNCRAKEFIYTPITNREDVCLSNHDSTALILNVPLTLRSPWDTAMNVHHQLWKISASEEPKVVQKWLRFWGWLPRFWGDSCFSSFSYYV